MFAAFDEKNLKKRNIKKIKNWWSDKEIKKEVTVTYIPYIFFTFRSRCAAIKKWLAIIIN